MSWSVRELEGVLAGLTIASLSSTPSSTTHPVRKTNMRESEARHWAEHHPYRQLDPPPRRPPPLKGQTDETSDGPSQTQSPVAMKSEKPPSLHHLLPASPLLLPASPNLSRLRPLSDWVDGSEIRLLPPLRLPRTSSSCAVEVSNGKSSQADLDSVLSALDSCRLSSMSHMALSMYS